MTAPAAARSLDPVYLQAWEGGVYVSAGTLTDALEAAAADSDTFVLSDARPVWLAYTERVDPDEHPDGEDGPGWVQVQPPLDGQQTDNCRRFWHFRETSSFETVAKRRRLVERLPYSRLRLTGNLTPGEETVELVVDAGSAPVLSFTAGEPPMVATPESLTGRMSRWQRDEQLRPLAEYAYTNRAGTAAQAIAEGDTRWGSTRINSVDHPVAEALEGLCVHQRQLIDAFDSVLEQIRWAARNGDEQDALALCRHLADAHDRDAGRS